MCVVGGQFAISCSGYESVDSVVEAVCFLHDVHRRMVALGSCNQVRNPDQRGNPVDQLGPYRLERSTAGGDLDSSGVVEHHLGDAVEFGADVVQGVGVDGDLSEFLGKVELRAYLQSQGDDTVADPPPRLLQRLASVQDQVRVWLPDAKSLSVADVLRVTSGAEPVDDERTASALMALAETVLDDFVAARAREGERLAQLIRERVTQLRGLAASAEPLVPEAVQAQKQRFLARWQEALSAGAGQVAPEAAQDRALAEATAFAIRIDVAEELGRLTAHLDEIESVLKKGGEAGKRLDFLIQELHREANTLGSKAAAMELTRISVDMKVLIEQMREQVQNIE